MAGGGVCRTERARRVALRGRRGARAVGQDRRDRRGGRGSGGGRGPDRTGRCLLAGCAQIGCDGAGGRARRVAFARAALGGCPRAPARPGRLGEAQPRRPRRLSDRGNDPVAVPRPRPLGAGGHLAAARRIADCRRRACVLARRAWGPRRGLVRRPPARGDRSVARAVRSRRDRLEWWLGDRRGSAAAGVDRGVAVAAEPSLETVGSRVRVARGRGGARRGASRSAGRSSGVVELPRVEPARGE